MYGSEVAVKLPKQKKLDISRKTVVNEDVQLTNLAQYTQRSSKYSLLDLDKKEKRS